MLWLKQVLSIVLNPWIVMCLQKSLSGLHYSYLDKKYNYLKNKIKDKKRKIYLEERETDV